MPDAGPQNKKPKKTPRNAETGVQNMPIGRQKTAGKRKLAFVKSSKRRSNAQNKKPRETLGRRRLRARPKKRLIANSPRPHA